MSCRFDIFILSLISLYHCVISCSRSLLKRLALCPPAACLFGTLLSSVKMVSMAPSVYVRAAMQELKSIKSMV